MTSQSYPVSESEPVAYQFRQRSAVGNGPQSSAPWCDWVCIEREDYERYVREPNKLVQVRPLYAGHAPSSQQWQPIETAPKDGLSILLGWAGSSSSEGFWHDGSKNYWKMAGFYFSDDDLLTAKPCEPTCWMHLPECPAYSSPAREGE